MNVVLKEITEALKDGGRIELRGFGSFTTKPRDGRASRNPRTGAAVVVKPTLAPLFRAAEQTVGTHINVSHEAATPPGLEVMATVELTAVEGRKLIFAVEAHDGHDVISRGTHERFVINRKRFDSNIAAKRPADTEIRGWRELAPMRKPHRR